MLINWFNAKYNVVNSRLIDLSIWARNRFLFGYRRMAFLLSKRSLSPIESVQVRSLSIYCLDNRADFEIDKLFPYIHIYC